MNTFLKVLGVIFLFLIAMKLAPVLIGPLLVIAGVAAAGLLCCLAGFGLAGALLFALIAVLTPVWLPIALFIGFIMLLVRLTRRLA